VTATLEDQREHERQKYLKLDGTTIGNSIVRYGHLNHGQLAYPTVLGWNPSYVLDFGCGGNQFVRELRRRGVRGAGIDFAMAGADIVAPMHEVPLPGAIADVITSFDALEHLLPEDVRPVLEEMRRLSKPGSHFCFSISYHPSGITVEGENLHMTVRSKSWWESEIERYAVVDPFSHYITGTWL